MIDLFLSNFKSGVYHVLHINAYHHLLFLIVLTVPYLFKDWKRVLLLISIFTLGHCVALALTIYNVINVNSKLISFLMPLTIFVIGLYNVFTAGKKAQNEKVGLLFFVSLFYGLLHGLSFEPIFNTMISSGENKPIALLEIALGLEIGQLVVAFIVVFLSFLCQTIFRFSKRDWVMVISAVVLGFVLPRLLQQL